jgi:hypothetical protein
MTDWYQTKTARKVGFTARPVVGGVFAQMLYRKAFWQKWAGRDKTMASGWAPMPKAPKIVTVIPAADKQAAKWTYTTANPGSDWMKENFDTTNWREGWGGFGTKDTPGAIVGTDWRTGDLWLRREVELSAADLPNLQFWLHHDDDAEVYLNGVEGFRSSGFTTTYEAFPISTAAQAALKPGKNLIAIHCHQFAGGQYLDLGFVRTQTDDSRQAQK